MRKSSWTFVVQVEAKLEKAVAAATVFVADHPTAQQKQ
jgi:hypothetical protein